MPHPILKLPAERLVCKTVPENMFGPFRRQEENGTPRNLMTSSGKSKPRSRTAERLELRYLHLGQN